MEPSAPTPAATPSAEPTPKRARDAEISALADLMRGRRTVVLAGAGCSTESGIPDYRGPRGRMLTRKPIQYGEFVGSQAARRRYWARSAIGWSRVAEARPNDTHRAIALLESGGHVTGVITQNVDGLHQRAGSRRVVELHGSLSDVVCLDCGHREGRATVQERVRDRNASWFLEMLGAERPASAPDGDAELPEEAYARFVVPDCPLCAGLLKPDVVFFGENVPKRRVQEAWGLVHAADVLLVLGSSLTVYSGRRFVYGATERAMDVAVVNMGPTRADDVARLKVEGRLGVVVPSLLQRLDEGVGPAG